MARILLVEDEAIITMMLEIWLMDRGHDLIGPAHDISSALELISNGGIDAAVVDLVLGPDKSYRVADALIEASIPFSWATGYERRDIDEAYRHLPVISKPYSETEFTAAVEALLMPR